MGLDKEQEAVLNILQHILSVRGLKTDSSNLRNLLCWVWEKGLISNASEDFELSVWEAAGRALWDLIITGCAAAKQTKKYATHWKLLIETLQSMQVERGVTSAASHPSGPALSNSPLANSTFSTHIHMPLLKASSVLSKMNLSETQ